MSKKISILNGPNLNLLGTREPSIYGTVRLSDIEERCIDHARGHGLSVDFRQSNHEGVLVDWIQEARNSACALIINAGAYTHTSIAILDALKNVDGMIIELHVTNIHKREQFRHQSFVTPAATGLIIGFGAHGYLMAIDAVAADLRDKAGANKQPD